MKTVSISLGYKYRLYPSKDQEFLLDHHMFISNQAYNICLNLQQEQWENNKDLAKKDRKYFKASEIDTKVKEALNQRDLPFKTVVTQQARMQADKALKDALIVKGRGFPKFKSSKGDKQSFTWNNQGFSLLNGDKNFKILRIMSQNIKLKYHRNIPTNAKICALTFSRLNGKYYVSFTISCEKIVSESPLKGFSKAIGLDMNVHNIALSDGILIPTLSKQFSEEKYSKKIVRLKRKQSRRLLVSKKKKQKLGANFKKAQRKINKIFEKSANQKKNHYHNISSELINIFDFIAVEDLNTKNMTKSAKGTIEKPGKMVSQKKGLNKSILNASFYEFISMLSYKATHNGKILQKVPPQYTSKACSCCGNINPNLTLKDRTYICECGHKMHRDVNAAQNILRLGLESFGPGTGLVDLKHKAFGKAS